MATEFQLSYTGSQINEKLSKIDSLATKSELPTKTSDLANDSGFLTSIPSEYVTETELSSKGYLTEHQDLSGYALKTEIPSVPVQSVNGQTGAVNLSATDVGALPNTTVIPSIDGLASESYVDSKIAAIPTPDVSGHINTHNTATNSHNDIRDLINGLTTRLNTLANSDDTTLDQMSEVVAYIKSNKSLIDAITTNKVNVADIINNLTTNVSNKPLSAAQGVALKALIDAIVVPTKVSELTNDKGYITGYTETDPTVPAWAKASSKPSYSKSEVGLGNVDNVKQYSASNPPPYPVTSVNGKTGAVTLDASDVGALSTSELSTAINTALVQAKDSGEFNGKNGTSVTVKSVTESTVDGGSNVVAFSDGKTVTIKNGGKGSAGKTPVLGTDYFTEADREDIIQQILAELGAIPVYGRIDANNNITLTAVLENGTYYLKYMNADGSVTDICTYNHNYVPGEPDVPDEPDVPEPTYTNVLPLAKGDDGNPYNGTGYAVGKRINSSWNETTVANTAATNPVFLTGRIPIPAGATVRFKNCYIDTNGVNGTVDSTADTNYYGQPLTSLYGCVLYYNPTSGTGNAQTTNYTWDKFTSWGHLASTPAVDSNGYVTEFTLNTTQTMYARFVLGGDPTTAIITINEPITD